MRHVHDGVLHRLRDDPATVSSRDYDHIAACARCQDRRDTIARDAGEIDALLSSPLPPIHSARALAAVHVRLADMPARHSIPERIMLMFDTRRRTATRSLQGLVAATAAVAVIALTPVGSLAESMLTVFQPRNFAAVSVTTQDVRALRQLPNLSRFGTMSQSGHSSMTQPTSAADASTAAGFHVATPASLPASIPATHTFTIVSAGTASFTFSAEKTRQVAARTGKPIPPMPADLDGSTLQVTLGPIAVSTYGGSSSLLRLGLRQGIARSASSESLPSVVVVQAPLPRVTSTKASAATIEDYLLSQPGISPDLAQEIRSIGDPTTTLPIPVPVNLATAQSVSVHGVKGLLIGDNTGVGSGVIWQQNHMVYGVAGPLTQDQVLAIANALQ